MINQLKRVKIQILTTTGFVPIDLNLPSGYAAKLATVTMGMSSTSYQAPVYWECGVSKTHYSRIDVPTVGQIPWRNDVLVYLNGGTLGIPANGTSVWFGVQRYDMEVKEHVFAIDPTFLTYASNSLTALLLFEYDLIKVSTDRIAEIYELQGGIA